jgi:hypothetical protein
MNNNKKIKTTYEALGFVEAMLAIMIVGVSSMVLMQIAVNTMQNIIQNEVIDDMTQYAVEGAEITQEIAFRDRQDDAVELFPTYEEYSGVKNCFVLEKREGLFYFKKEENEDYVQFKKDEEGAREDYKDEATLDEENDRLFRLICLDPETASGGVGGEPAYVMAEIVVGQRSSEGTVTKGNLVKDYVYRTIIKL